MTQRPLKKYMIHWNQTVGISMAKRNEQLAITQKIKLLESEGYKSPQAIAIALDMNRRGTLPIPIVSKRPKSDSLSSIKRRMKRYRKRK